MAETAIFCALLLATMAGARVINNQGQDLSAFGNADSRIGCYIVEVDAVLRRPGCEDKPYKFKTCQGRCLSITRPASPLESVKPFESSSFCCRVMNSTIRTERMNCQHGFPAETIYDATHCSCFDCR